MTKIDIIKDSADVAIYTRVSSNIQVEKGYSLEAQRKAGIKFCEDNKLTYMIFEEAGKSADKETLANRPKIEEILTLAEDKNIKYIFTTELDRLSRNPFTLEIIKKSLKDNNVKIATVGQIYDLKDEESEFLADIMGLLAKRENRVRVKRSKRAKVESALKGKWVCSVTPFGFSKTKSDNKDEKNKLIPDSEESKIYNMIVEWCLEGIGVNIIARKLNEMGIITKWSKCSKKGKKFKWKAGTIWKILKSPLYKGKYLYSSHEIINASPLISEEKWDLIQEQLKKNYNKAERNTKRFYLLKGLLICKKCGRGLFGLIKPKKGMRCYCCISKHPDPEPRFCGLKNINLDKLNNIVWEKIVEIVKNSKKLEEAIKTKKDLEWSGKILSDTGIEIIDKAIKKNDEELDNLLDLYNKSKVFTIEELDKKAIKIKSEREALVKEKEIIMKEKVESEITQENIRNIEDYMHKISKRINSFSEQEKYDFLHLFINRIVVDYDKNIGHTIEIEGAIPVFDREKDDVEEKLRREIYPPLYQGDRCSVDRRRKYTKAG